MNVTSNLPADLVEFFSEGRQLEYDIASCEAGRVTLRPIVELVVQLFPQDTQNSTIEANDPHRGELGCYLVPAVDLVGAAEDYEATGLLIWLPIERRFGTWDSNRPFISVFGQDVTWSKITAAPAKFINAQWDGAFEDSAPTTPLIPWPQYAYELTQVFEPRGLARMIHGAGS